MSARFYKNKHRRIDIKNYTAVFIFYIIKNYPVMFLGYKSPLGRMIDKLYLIK